MKRFALFFALGIALAGSIMPATAATSNTNFWNGAYEARNEKGVRIRDFVLEITDRTGRITTSNGPTVAVVVEDQKTFYVPAWGNAIATCTQAADTCTKIEWEVNRGDAFKPLFGAYWQRKAGSTTPKQDPPKQDPPKQDPPKQDPPKQDPPKQDPPKGPLLFPPDSSSNPQPPPAGGTVAIPPKPSTPAPGNSPPPNPAETPTTKPPANAEGTDWGSVAKAGAAGLGLALLATGFVAIGALGYVVLADEGIILGLPMLHNFVIGVLETPVLGWLTNLAYKGVLLTTRSGAPMLKMAYEHYDKSPILRTIVRHLGYLMDNKAQLAFMNRHPEVPMSVRPMWQSKFK